MQNENLIIDFFAGGGGASVGIEMALGRPVDIAINHDPDAIRIHKANHPDALHLTEDIFTVDLQKYVKGRHVALIWASPDCTSHSKAKGGKPRKHGLRILPWAVYKHARKILPDVIVMENVEEIQQWGPLDSEDHPIRERKGEDYKKFIMAMTSLGYRFESRELVAADYGAPTTRKRWYAFFRRDNKEIVWPKQTHSKTGENGLHKWESIWKYLDLTDTGNSIFGRKKPLAEKTMHRIARGLEKFVFNSKEPFIVQVNHGGEGFRGQDIHSPLPTVTQKHGFGLVSPVTIPLTDKACGEITASHKYMISPFLIQYHSETAKNSVRGQTITEPLQTIDTSNRYGLVMQFLTKFYKSGTGQSMWEPIHTITTSPGHFGQVSVYTVPKEQLLESIRKNKETSEQMEAIVQKCTWVSQYIMEYYGSGTGQSIKDPLHTIVTKDRFALITVLGCEYAIVDICLRMLKAEPELKLGQGYPEDYIIDHDYMGKKYPISKQVARIGNSVVPIMAQKLIESNCGYLKVGKRMPNLHIDDSGQQLKFA